MSLIGGLLAGAAQGVNDSWSNRRAELKVEAANSFKLATEQRKIAREDELAAREAMKVNYVKMQKPGTTGEVDEIIVAVHPNGQVADNLYNRVPTIDLQVATSVASEMADKKAQLFGFDETDFAGYSGSRAKFIEETAQKLVDQSSIYRMFGGTGGDQVSEFTPPVDDKATTVVGEETDPIILNAPDYKNFGLSSADIALKQNEGRRTKGSRGGDGSNNKVETIVTTASKKKEEDQDIRTRMAQWSPETGMPPSLLKSAIEQPDPEVTTTPEYYQEVRDRMSEANLGSLLASANEQSGLEDTTTPLDVVEVEPETKTKTKTSYYDDSGDHNVSNFVIEQEAFSPVAYPDGSGWAIGYGTNNESVKEGQTITKEKAFKLMQKDLKSNQDYVDKLVTVPLTPNQNAAIVSLMYSTGYGNIRDSQALLALNSGNYEMFAELAFGDKGFIYTNIDGVKQISEGLVNRRKRERVLFNDNKPSTRPPNSAKEFEAAYFNL